MPDTHLDDYALLWLRLYKVIHSSRWTEKPGDCYVMLSNRPIDSHFFIRVTNESSLLSDY